MMASCICVKPGPTLFEKKEVATRFCQHVYIANFTSNCSSSLCVCVCALLTACCILGSTCSQKGPLQSLDSQKIMARRSSALLVVAILAVLGLASLSFVPSAPQALRGDDTMAKDRVTQAAALSAAVLTVPEIAHAGNSGYALLQLGWAIFIISLGPAVLFWVYFNKPELL